MWTIFGMMKNALGRFHRDEEGVGTVEIILITIVVIGLVVLFRDSIYDLVETLTESMKNQASSI
ncbi:MAG: holin, BlyA family protein [Lachnospiraceae bacterium]|nr:holin, BlyA family protein [Lachnospiraceae bacterium]MCH4032180.1 holin, BlyA family protein [Lachnospiraceae bacterium]MCH4108942.1 holin, BlyA family protein [Lachnospiraceae bacterium]MCI1332344.1 holin, BlyA family protein [Lachnospiraceae bacterium]MCI1361705.1 holin, BlyA family protein [Lachnospiraceae bacterium]